MNKSLSGMAAFAAFAAGSLPYSSSGIRAFYAQKTSSKVCPYCFESHSNTKTNGNLYDYCCREHCMEHKPVLRAEGLRISKLMRSRKQLTKKQKHQLRLKALTANRESA